MKCFLGDLEIACSCAEEGGEIGGKADLTEARYDSRPCIIALDDPDYWFMSAASFQ